MHWELALGDYLVGQTTESIKLLYNPFIAPAGSGRDTDTHPRERYRESVRVSGRARRECDRIDNPARFVHPSEAAQQHNQIKDYVETLKLRTE